MGEIHELFVLALSLVWFAGAIPDLGSSWVLAPNFQTFSVSTVVLLEGLESRPLCRTRCPESQGACYIGSSGPPGPWSRIGSRKGLQGPLSPGVGLKHCHRTWPGEGSTVQQLKCSHVAQKYKTGCKECAPSTTRYSGEAERAPRWSMQSGDNNLLETPTDSCHFPCTSDTLIRPQ